MFVNSLEWDDDGIIFVTHGKVGVNFVELLLADDTKVDAMDVTEVIELINHGEKWEVVQRWKPTE